MDDVSFCIDGVLRTLFMNHDRHGEASGTPWKAIKVKCIAQHIENVSLLSQWAL